VTENIPTEYRTFCL